MKKIIFGSALVLALLTGCGAESQVQQASIEKDTVMQVQTTEGIKDANVYYNVGNGVGYAYKVTEVTDSEINGLPLNYASEGNQGILLYPEEVAFDVKVGDEILVVWGENEDEFELIEKAIQKEDGTYVSESYSK